MLWSIHSQFYYYQFSCWYKTYLNFYLIIKNCPLTNWEYLLYYFFKDYSIYSWPTVNCVLMRIINNISFLIVERRRRYNINYRIKELGTLIPKSNDPWVQNHLCNNVVVSVSHKWVGGKREDRSNDQETKHLTAKISLLLVSLWNIYFSIKTFPGLVLLVVKISVWVALRSQWLSGY